MVPQCRLGHRRTQAARTVLFHAGQVVTVHVAAEVRSLLKDAGVRLSELAGLAVAGASPDGRSCYACKLAEHADQLSGFERLSQACVVVGCVASAAVPVG